MLDKKGYRHTLRIHSIYFFSTATIVTQTHLNITFIRTLPLFESTVPVEQQSRAAAATDASSRVVVLLLL
jgi:hypothetical protein